MSREEFLRYLAANPMSESDGTPDLAEGLYHGFLMYQAQQNLPPTTSSPQPATSTPNTEGSVSVPQVTIEDLLNAPGRQTLTTLDPERKGKSTWFKYDNGEINRAILKMVRTDVPKAYPTYSKLPEDVKRRWFRAFAQQFNWEPSITETVKAVFEQKAARKFSSNLCEWKGRLKHGKDPPNSMTDTKWTAYQEMWKEKKVIDTSEKNTQNKNSDRGGDGGEIHNTGSKTYEKRKEELRVENGGEEPDMLTLIEDIHRSRKNGGISDKRIKRVVDKCKEKINEELSQGGSTQSNQLTQAEINAVVRMETTVVKGRRLGLGTLPDPDQEATSSRSSLSNLAVEEQLRKDIEVLKKDKAEHEKTIKYLAGLAKKVVDKFPEFEDQAEDEDDTQE